MWPNGKTKIKTGGRTLGTPNKATQSIREMLDSLGCNPLREMAIIAADKTVDIKLRAQMYRDLAPYYAPKLAATVLSVQQEEVAYPVIPTTLEALLEVIKKDPFMENIDLEKLPVR